MSHTIDTAPPNLFARISRTQIGNRPVLSDQRTLYGGRVEALYISHAGLSLVVGLNKTVGLFVEIPFGEVWKIHHAQFIIVSNVAANQWSEVSLWTSRKTVNGGITNPPDVNWSTSVSPVFFRISGNETITAAGGIADADFTSHLGEGAGVPGTGENLGYPILDSGSELLFRANNDAGAGSTVSALQFRLLFSRVQVGEEYLETLRKQGISDAELQRKLQAVATVGFPNAHSVIT